MGVPQTMDRYNRYIHIFAMPRQDAIGRRVVYLALNKNWLSRRKVSQQP